MNRHQVRDAITGVKRAVTRLTDDDGPLHQKLVCAEDDLEDTIAHLDEEIDHAAQVLDARMAQVGVALARAGREFDGHLEEVGRELDAKTEHFTHVIAELLGDAD